MSNFTLYSKIEHLIIEWNNDGTQTAGSLTRKIMQLFSEKEEKEISIEFYNEQFFEKNRIFNEAYEKYCILFIGYDDIPTKEVFIFECETNEVFRKKWIKD